MSVAANLNQGDSPLLLPNLLQLCEEASANAERLLARAIVLVRAKVSVNGVLDSALIEREQHAVHGLAWLATYTESIKQMTNYAQRLSEAGRFGELEALLTQIGIGEYVTQILGGIPMSQTEMARFHDFDLSVEDRDMFATGAVIALIKGNSPQVRLRAITLMRDIESGGSYGDGGLDDTLEAMRGEMRRFVEAEVKPHAHEWHLQNAYIPLRDHRQDE